MCFDISIIFANIAYDIVHMTIIYQECKYSNILNINEMYNLFVKPFFVVF